MISLIHATYRKSYIGNARRIFVCFLHCFLHSSCASFMYVLFMNFSINGCNACMLQTNNICMYYALKSINKIYLLIYLLIDFLNINFAYMYHALRITLFHASQNLEDSGA